MVDRRSENESISGSNIDYKGTELMAFSRFSFDFMYTRTEKKKKKAFRGIDFRGIQVIKMKV